MFSKFITFIIIPERTGNVKKARFSVRSIVLLSTVGLIFVSLWGYVVYDYVSIRSRLINLVEKQKLYSAQQQRIEVFSQQYDNTQIHFNHLASLYDKLKRLTSMTGATAQPLVIDKETPEYVKQLQTAVKQGVLQIIASDISEIDTDKKLQASRFAKLLSFFQENKSPLLRIPRGTPLKGYMISEFGVLQDSFTGQLRPRHGILIATRAFTPLYATADGIVRYAGEDEYYGHLIVIDHTNGIVSKYGYVSALKVKEGEIVRVGQKLAAIHNTQRTSGPQLYYEIDVNNIPQNPIRFIKPLSLKD